MSTVNRASGRAAEKTGPASYPSLGRFLFTDVHGRGTSSPSMPVVDEHVRSTRTAVVVLSPRP